jgi:RND family efflux transporter MFP subunit
MLAQLLKRVSFWLSIFGFGVVVALVNATTAKPPIPPPLSAPAEKPFAKGVGASGIIEAIHENTQVGVPLPGLVTELPVKVWDRVKAGEVLIKLDDREVRAKLTTQEAELALREAELDRARRQHERLARLSTAAQVREDLDKRADEIPVSEAGVAHAQAAIRQTHELLDLYVVRAPISGSILQVNTRLGEYLSPGASTAPLVLGSIDELQIRVDVDEQLAPRIQEQARAVAFRKGASSEAMTLEFIRIEPFIIPKRNLTGDSSERVDTRVLPVIFRIQPHPGLKAYVGQQVDVFIEETEQTLAARGPQ